MGLNYFPGVDIMREIHIGGVGMDIPVMIGSLAILSEISILTFMLLKEFFLPYVGQCFFDSCRKVRKKYGK